MLETYLHKFSQEISPEIFVSSSQDIKNGEIVKMGKKFQLYDSRYGIANIENSNCKKNWNSFENLYT